MHRRVISGRKAVSRWVGVGIIVLTLLSVGLLVATLGLFLGLRDSRDAVARSIREDAVWAAFQTDREAARLVEALLVAQVEDSSAEISRRFDLLYSRLGLLKSGKYGIAFGAGSGVGEKAAAVVSLVLAFAPEVDAMAAGTQPSRAGVAGMLVEARAIRQASGELIVAANAAVNDLRVAEREATLSTYMHIGLAVAGLTIVLVLIVGLLALQLRHISTTGRRLEKLGLEYAQAAHDAEAANRAKSAFLATMSHEIRTPLNAIIGMADLIKQAGLTGEQAAQLNIIRQAGDVLLDVISDILDYSKLEAGAVAIERSSASLPEIVESVRAIMLPRAAAAGLELEMIAPQVMVTVDAARLRQILLNLVGNAVKFTKAGSVRVVATLDDERLRVDVADTGPGIPVDQFGRLFRDFSQLDSSTTRAFGGTGLGLAICRRLTDAMGGRIDVMSTVGKGSTFWLELPVAPVSVLPLPVAVAKPFPDVPQAGLALVVDDNEVNRQVASGLLRSLGWNTECAENGRAALDRMAAQHFDVVLMDMQMPVLDGLEATRQARAAGIRTPIIGLTANAFKADRDACIAAGMDEHLAKPVTRDKLARILADRSALDTRSTAPSNGDIDEAQQRVLREELGEDVFDGLLVSFADDARRLVEDARSAAAAGDAVRYDAALHTLKGAALTLGYAGLGKLASDLRSTAPAEEQLEPLTLAVDRLAA